MRSFWQSLLGLSLTVLLPLGVVGCAQGVVNTTRQQDLVDRSTLALQEMLGGSQSKDLVGTLRSARAVIICPQVFKAGVVIGGSGGSCVLMGRAAAGSWSDPAFYSLGSGSFGPQIGVQDAELMIMIMNDRALTAVMNDRFKLGGDASFSAASIGAGVGGATTTAMRADIVTFAKTRGLYAGASIEGSVLSSDPKGNAAYYGKPYTAPEVAVQMLANNPGANPLRQTLSTYGG
jgi:SH3 domain-containing YSC84-like protein 1